MATIDTLIDRIDRLIAAIETTEDAAGAGTGRSPPDPGRDYEAEAQKAEQLAAIYDKINSSRAQQHKTELLVEGTTARIYELRQKIKDSEGTASEEKLKNLMNQLEALEKREDLIKRSNESAKDLADSFGSIFSGQAPALEGMLDPKNIQGMAKKLDGVAAAGNLSQMASQAATAALFEYSKAAINLAIDLADVEAAFMKATGANEDFARSITESYQETRKFGSTAQETSAAAQLLFTTFTDFTIASENTRENLIETSAVLAKMGISNQDFAKSIQISTKALSMSADQAAQNMLNLEKFAENLGVAPQQLAADFAGAGDMLAKMGSQGTKAFKDLAIVAKTTGMQMDSILAITNKFDTFEGAADQAGKLNAALGGNFVNAIDLMMATEPAERFEMIRDSILDAGLSFDEMSYYQKNFYKESLGLKDVNELALLMSGNISLMAGATQQSEQSMIDAAKRARDMASLQEKLNMALHQMIPIIMPVIDAFTKFTSFIADNMDVIKPLVGILIALSAALMGPVGAVAAIVLGLSILFDSIETGKDEVSLLSEIFRELGTIFEPMIDYYKELGLALKQLGVEFGLVGEDADGFSSIIKGTASVFVSLIKIYMGPLRAAFTIMGSLVKSARTGTNHLSEAVEKLGNMMFLTRFNPPSFLLGLFEIADGFSNIIENAAALLNPFTAVERAISGIGNVFSSIIGGATSFFAILTNPEAATNIAKIGKAISDVKVANAAAFTTAMTATAAASTAGTARAAVEGATETVNNLIFGSEKGKQGSQPQQITVNLMLDRTKLATIVREINGETARDAVAGRA